MYGGTKQFIVRGSSSLIKMWDQSRDSVNILKKRENCHTITKLNFLDSYPRRLTIREVLFSADPYWHTEKHLRNLIFTYMLIVSMCQVQGRYQQSTIKFFSFPQNAPFLVSPSALLTPLILRMPKKLLPRDNSLPLSPAHWSYPSSDTWLSLPFSAGAIERGNISVCWRDVLTWLLSSRGALHSRNGNPLVCHFT